MAEKRKTSKRPEAVFTIGHSTRPIEEFLALLDAHDVQQLIDIRSIPRSRHNPQFDGAALAASVRHAGIRYAQLKGLGGLRHARKDSRNTGWRNASFRGYADYMQTPEFTAALKQLLAKAATRRTAIMCAEALPWRCHRSLVADALSVKRVPVEHIMSASRAQRHKLTPFIRVARGRISYPDGNADAPTKLAILPEARRGKVQESAARRKRRLLG